MIVDDASTDGTVDVIRRELDGIPLRLVRNSQSRFSNEVELRRQQWEESLASNPDWLLVLDGDDILEPAAKTIIPDLIKQTDYAVVGFHLYDFWSPTHYREDEWWSAHKSPRPFLLRYTPDFIYKWHDAPQHCGRIPSNVFELNTAAINLRVKHMGWSNPRSENARRRAIEPWIRKRATASRSNMNPFWIRTPISWCGRMSLQSADTGASQQSRFWVEYRIRSTKRVPRFAAKG